MSFIGNIINKLKYWLLALLLVPFLAWFVNADDDLMRQIMEPAVNEGATIDVWKSVNRVWKNVIEGNTEFDIDKWWLRVKNGPSIIVRVTRVLPSLIIALSITMILYNWLSYIIQTWQWKEGKNLVSNVVYIVIWIIVSLLSVTIITILQSVSTTLKDETIEDRSSTIDERLMEGQEWRTWRSWWQIFNNKTKI